MPGRELQRNLKSVGVGVLGRSAARNGAGFSAIYLQPQVAWMARYPRNLGQGQRS